MGNSSDANFYILNEDDFVLHVKFIKLVTEKCIYLKKLTFSNSCQIVFFFSLYKCLTDIKKPVIPFIRSSCACRIDPGQYSNVYSCLLSQADRPPSLVSSPCLRPPTLDGPVTLTEAKVSVPDSPQPSVSDSLDCVEDRADGGVLEGTGEVPSSETCASSFPGWIKSPDRGLTGPAGLNFSPVNSNLRDLTPSHTLEPLAAPFRPEAAAGAAAGTGSLVSTQAPFIEGQGQLFYPGSEEGGLLSFSRSLNGDGGGEGVGSAQNPPQKKKVSKPS